MVNDGTDIAELMACMVQRNVENEKFPMLSREVNVLKTTEGGVSVMCDIMEKYLAEAKSETIIQTVKTMRTRGFSEQEIISFVIEAYGLTEEQAQELMELAKAE